MKALSGQFTSDVISYVNMVIGHALTMEKGRTGGYFCLADRNDGSPLLIAVVGKILDAEKASRYLRNAQEKCQRLAATNGLLASETANVAEGKYAGSVKGASYIFSFSGLPEFLDEAAMLIVATLSDELPYDLGAKLGLKSRNQFFDELCDKCSASAVSVIIREP